MAAVEYSKLTEDGDCESDEDNVEIDGDGKAYKGTTKGVEEVYTRAWKVKGSHVLRSFSIAIIVLALIIGPFFFKLERIRVEPEQEMPDRDTIYPITFPRLRRVSEDNLSCSFQATVYGHDFAAMSQRYRMMTYLSDDSVNICNKVYFRVGKSENAKILIDGPGSSFTNRMQFTASLRVHGELLHFTEYPYVHKSGLGHKEPAFFEYLFGFSMNEPCADELRSRCGCISETVREVNVLDAISDAKFYKNMLNATRSSASANTKICPKIIEVDPSHPTRSVCLPSWLRRDLVTSYERMRSILPLQTSYSNVSNVNIAVHVRTGQGERKGFDSASFLNISMWLTKALDDRGRGSMVHLLTEINGTSFDAWKAFNKTQNLRVYMDMNRYDMFHHFVKADIIINSNSGFSHTASWANKGLKLYLSSFANCNSISSLWNPCQGDNIKKVEAVAKNHNFSCQGIGVKMRDVEAILDKSFGRKL